MDDVIHMVEEAYDLHCPYTEKKTQELDRQPVLHSMEQASGVTANNLELEKIVIWSHLAAHLAPSVKPLVLFSCSIPEFYNLNLCDKVTCIKQGFFEIWLVQVSRLVNYQDGTITFCNGYYISKYQLEMIYDKEFVEKLFNFSGCLNDLQLSDTVIALYSIVILHNAERSGIKQSMPLRRIREKYLKYLKYHLDALQQIQMFDILVSMLPELHIIGKTHLHHVEQIWADSLQQSEMPFLLTEPLDFIRDEEDIMYILQSMKLKRQRSVADIEI